MKMVFVESASASSLTSLVQNYLNQGYEFVEMQTCAEVPSSHSYSSGSVKMLVVLQKS